MAIPSLRISSALPLLPLAFALLAGCSTLSNENAQSVEAAPADPQEQVRALFAQAYIDPLTRFIERNPNSPHLDALRAERRKRCERIAHSYADKEANADNLARLERGYRYSCPDVVDAFARRSAGTAASTPQAAQTSSEPGVASAPGAPRPGARVDGAERENCYLLFAIRNYREVLAACRAPANGGDARAQHNLGIAAGALKKHGESVQWMRRAAAQGLAEAQLQLGLACYAGRGVERNPAQALRHFQQAAAQGLAEAQYMAGSMYRKGEGSAANPAKAAEWLNKAAQQNHGKAQLELAELYARGEGVPADPVRARRWLQAAASQGVAEARFRLGKSLADGAGSPADLIQAYVWLSLAHADGHGAAGEQLANVGRKLTPEALDDARQRILRAAEQQR